MKHVLITGGSSGIGEEIARLLATSAAVPAYRVIIVGRDEEKLRKVKIDINSLVSGGELVKEEICYTLCGDTSNEADVDRMYAEAMQIFDGRVDVAILNAGEGLLAQVRLDVASSYEFAANSNGSQEKPK